jgi:hypothetical protein
MDVHGQPLDRAGLLAHIGQLSQVAGVRLVTLADGAGRGTRVLEFRSGAGLEFEIIVDRAFDIGHASIAGRPLAWVSPVGIEGPWFREPVERGWLRGFGGGLLATGGLDHLGQPETADEADPEFPAKLTNHYPLHGRLSGEPATLVGYGARWEGDDCTLWAEGLIRQASVFGEVLELRRRVDCRVGTNEFRLRDTVTNDDYSPSSHMMLYHVNLGFPLVADGSQLVLDHESVTPRGDFPAQGWDHFGPPTRAATEEVLEIRPNVGTDGRVLATVVNAQHDLALYEHYRADTLPYMFLWRMLGEGTYVVGLEPSTNGTTGRRDARANGELVTLGPGESRDYELVIGAHSGTDAVAAHLRRHS